MKSGVPLELCHAADACVARLKRFSSQPPRGYPSGFCARRCGAKLLQRVRFGSYLFGALGVAKRPIDFVELLKARM